MQTKAKNLAFLAPVRTERHQLLLGRTFDQLAFALQTTLDVEQLLDSFSNHLATAVPHDGWDYIHSEQKLALSAGCTAGNSCSYQVQLENTPLGNWRATREYPFSPVDMATIEAYLCRLIYPLRNALQYWQALQSAYLDPLTQARNRGALSGSLQREWELARRHGHPLSIIMIDVDHFKSINDTHGHGSGDLVLKQLADCLNSSVRGSDVVFRYGGEEFLILLANTCREGARLLAERVRSDMAHRSFVSCDGTALRVTASLGVASLSGDESKETLMARADRALYRAKNEGRDRVSVAED